MAISIIPGTAHLDFGLILFVSETESLTSLELTLEAGLAAW